MGKLYKNNKYRPYRFCVSSCLCALVVKKGAPPRHQDTKNYNHGAGVRLCLQQRESTSGRSRYGRILLVETQNFVSLLIISPSFSKSPRGCFFYFTKNFCEVITVGKTAFFGNDIHACVCMQQQVACFIYAELC